MTIGILGTPAAIASGAGYTPAAGSNRVVVMLAASKASAGARTLTNISWNSVTRTPTVTNSDSATANRDGVGICVFKESELPAGSQNATATWSGSTDDSNIFCFTIGDVDQTTTVRTSGSSVGLTVSNQTGSIAQTVTVGDFQLAVAALRNNVGTLMVPLNSFTESFDMDSGIADGAHGAGYKIAVGTSSPVQWSETSGGADDGYALATIALMPFTASAGSSMLSLLGVG